MCYIQLVFIFVVISGIDDFKSPKKGGKGNIEGTIDLGLPSKSVGLVADLTGGKGKADTDIPSAR